MDNEEILKQLVLGFAKTQLAIINVLEEGNDELRVKLRQALRVASSGGRPIGIPDLPAQAILRMDENPSRAPELLQAEIAEFLRKPS